MPTVKEIKIQIDGLSLKEQNEITKYLETSKVATGDVANNLQATESQEIAQKSLEFEDGTFKIDSTSWQEEIRIVSGESQKVKVSPKGDVIEYLAGPAKGEQLFIGYKNFINYVAQAKGCSVQEAEYRYLLTREELQTKMNKVNYIEFYNSQIKGYLAGCYSPSVEKCLYVGLHSGLWLSGGCTAGFGLLSWDSYYYNASFGFSGRLLKN